MKRLFGIVAVCVALASPVAAKANVDDTNMARCVSRMDATSCAFAYQYYLHQLVARASLDDMCHNAYDTAATEFLFGLDTHRPARMANANGILEVAIKTCASPWTTRARSLLVQTSALSQSRSRRSVKDLPAAQPRIID